VWPPDEQSPLIWENMNKLTEMYGLKLDMIYEGPQFDFEGKYSEIYSWNSTFLPASSVGFESYAALACAAVPLSILTCVTAYYVMRLRKQRPAKTVVVPASTGKARLRNLGDGTLELTDSSIKFYVKKGRIRKRKEIAREIPIVDIENIERVGNEFTITWKGTTDTFVAEKTELVQAIHDKVTEALKEQRKTLQDEEATKQKRAELTKMLSVSVEIVDSLFDILRSLHGRVNWNRVESSLTRYEENARNLKFQSEGAVNFESAKLSSAIKEHILPEISKETFGILRSLYDYFSESTAKTEIPEQIHPNYHDAKATILAYYTLNDIILGVIVGDEEIGKESKELVTMLEALSKVTDSKITVDAVKDVVNKLVMEKGKENFIEESRAALRQQLKELATK
jgi:hypothetical protein